MVNAAVFAGLIVLFFVLQVVDVVLTLRILREGGRELNPFVRVTMKYLGETRGFLLLKLILCAAVLVLLTHIPTVLILALDIVYVVVLVRNFKELNR